jgi:hypothetical protein
MLVSGGPVSSIPVSAAPIFVATQASVPYFDYVQSCFVLTWTSPEVIAYQIR